MGRVQGCMIASNALDGVPRSRGLANIGDAAMPKIDQVRGRDKASFPTGDAYRRHHAQQAALVMNKYKGQVRAFKIFDGFLGWQYHENTIHGVIGDGIDPLYLFFGPVSGGGQYQAKPRLAQNLSCARENW